MDSMMPSQYQWLVCNPICPTMGTKVFEQHQELLYVLNKIRRNTQQWIDIHF